MQRRVSATRVIRLQAIFIMGVPHSINLGTGKEVCQVSETVRYQFLTGTPLQAPEPTFGKGDREFERAYEMRVVP